LGEREKITGEPFKELKRQKSGGGLYRPSTKRRMSKNKGKKSQVRGEECASALME